MNGRRISCVLCCVFKEYIKQQQRAVPVQCITAVKETMGEGDFVVLVYALASALFAALTTVLAKLGLDGVNSTLATAVRTAVVLLFSWGIVWASGNMQYIHAFSRRNWIFLILSGLAKGFYWICYFKALQMGKVGQVVAIDKFSIVLTVGLAALFAGEALTAKTLAGAILIAAGTLVMVL